MSEEQALDFDQWCDHFIPLDVVTSPAELQGALVGILSGGRTFGPANWLAWFLEFADAQKEPSAELTEAIQQFYQGTVDSLQDNQLGFQLLIPDEDTELAVRINALAEWCEGFLVGFGSSGISADTQFSTDVTEMLQDLASIAQVADDELEQDAEKDFFELAEYVRVVAMRLFAEFTSENTAESNQSSQSGQSLFSAGTETSSEEHQDIGSVKNLFGKKLH